jgi:hypothetical protein
MVHGRNPDGRKFLCKEVIEVNFLLEIGITVEYYKPEI